MPHPMTTALESLINDPSYKDLLSIVKGFRNGLVYGVKIRFPHALVMTLLFRSGSLFDKAKFIFKATKQHARNLGLFVMIYKTLMILQRRLNGGKERKADSFFAGLVGGYVIFGSENNSVNQQIVLYVASRVMLGLGKLTVKKGIVPPLSKGFSSFAAITWGLVMYLFAHEQDVVQESMAASMVYLYRDSDHWKDLRTLLWHNQ